MRLPAFNPLPSRPWFPSGPTSRRGRRSTIPALLLILAAVSVLVLTDTGRAGAQSGELGVSISADAASLEAGDTVTLTADISNAPQNEDPAYAWDICTDAGTCISNGQHPLKFNWNKAGIWTFQLTVSYDSGASARSNQVSVAWSDAGDGAELPPEPDAAGGASGDEGATGDQAADTADANSPGNVRLYAHNNNDVWVTWDAPTVASGRTLSAYRVELRVEGATPRTLTPRNVSSGASEFTSRRYRFSSLTNGTSYTVRVAARTHPDDDSTMTADAWSARTASVAAWSEPTQLWFVSDRPSITALGRVHMEVLSNKGKDSVVCQADGPDMTAAQLNCPPGVLISMDTTGAVTASATSLHGGSTSPSEGARGGPRGFLTYASGGAGRIVIAWVSTASSTTDYIVQYRSGTSGAWTDVVKAATARSHTVTGLADGTYQIRARGRITRLEDVDHDDDPATPKVEMTVHYLGFTSEIHTLTVAASNTGTVRPRDVQQARSADGQSLIVQWELPTATGGSKPYAWQVRHRAQGTSAWTSSAELHYRPTQRLCHDRDGTECQNPRSYTISGLTAGTDYQVDVRARNANGWGAYAINDAPTVANMIPDRTAEARTAFSFQFAANTFSDADGDTLTYTATQDDGSALPSWLSFDASTRTFSGTPGDLDAGTLSVKVTASDGINSVSDTFDIVVSTDRSPPTVANMIPDRTAEARTAFSFQFAANTFSDADGDTLTYTATQDDGSALPSWLSFTAATRTFAGTPARSDVGTLSVKVTAGDGTWTVSDTFDIVVSLDPPAFWRSMARGTTLYVDFDQSLDTASRPPSSAFRVTAGPKGGAARTIAGTATVVNISNFSGGSRVEIELARAVAEGEVVRVRYVRPSANPLQNSAGKQAASFSGQPVLNGPPRILTQAISSDPGPDRLYTLGDQVQVQVTFDVPVVVDTTGGRPRLRISLGLWDGGSQAPGEARGNRWSHYLEGSGTTTLTFQYTVQRGDYSGEPAARGVAVFASGLNLNGGAIRSAWNQPLRPAENAESIERWPDTLPNPWLDFDRNHRVDARPPGALWEATLNPKGSAPRNHIQGCDDGLSSWACYLNDRLQETTFYLEGRKHSVLSLINQADARGWQLSIIIEPRIPGDDWTLEIDGREFCVEAARTYGLSNNAIGAYWDGAPLSWSEGTPVQVKLKKPAPGAPWTCGSPEDQPVFESAAVGGETLTMTFSHDLVPEVSTGYQGFESTPPAPGAFHVTVNGVRRNVAADGVAVSGKTVRLTLASPVTSDDTVTVRYTRPSENELRRVHGAAVETFADQAVTHAVPLASNLGQSNDEGSSTHVYNAQTFTTGSHGYGYTLFAVQIQMGVWTNADGVSVFPDYEVELWRVGSNGQPADDRPENKLATFTKPDTLIHGINTFHTAESIELRPETQYAVVVDLTRTCTCTVRNTHSDDDSTLAGWSIANNSWWRRAGETTWRSWHATRKIALLGAARQGSGAGGDSGPGGLSAETIPGTEPDTSLSTANTASVTGVTVTSDAGDDDTYARDDVIQVTVTFSEAVDVTGTPQIAIDMDPAEWGTKQAAYESGSGTASLVFAHTVVEPNISTQGIAVLANTLALNGGTIQSAADVDADLSHTGLAHNASHKVDWQLPSEEGGAVGQGDDGGDSDSEEESVPPSVTAVAVSSDAGSDDTYVKDDVIRVTLTFSEAVDVDTTDGAPRLKIDMDPAEWGDKWAAYESGSGTASLVFAHTVAEPNVSNQGIAVLANTLDLNSGTIQSASDVDADLSHTGLAHDANHKVRWQPVVTAVAVTSDAGGDDTYARDDVIQITVTFSEAVDVDTTNGTPQIAIDMDPAEWGTKWASYHSGSGTTTLTFTHTVVEPNISTQGIAVLANTLKLNGGTIQSASAADADLSHTGLTHNAGHKVNWQLEPPVGL